MALETIHLALKAIKYENEDLQSVCEKVGLGLERKNMEIEEATQILSEHILKFENALLFKKYLSNILLALVSAKIPLKPVFSHSNFDACTDSEKTNHLEFSIVLSLMSDHPDILQYALKYFEINPVPPFEIFIHHDDSYNVAPKKRRLLDCRQKITDLQMVQCCYTLLKKLPNELSTKWDWTKFINSYSQHEDTEIRWILKECMVILTNMTELQSNKLARHLNLSEDCVEFLSKHQSVEIVTNEETVGDTNTASVVNIDGIMLPIFDKDKVQNGNLVPVKSTLSNLRSLALAVASGKALCLLGPVGSGKTSLVEYLASITGRKGVAFKKVQLGDQTDSRMLLGSHQCTDVPGEFVWRPGVLTEAVQNGHWLLLEDIDSAALDVASTLSSLLERNALCVPGYRDSLPVTPGFQLFVTQRTLVTNYGFQKKMSNSSTLLQKHLTQINVEPLSRSELAEIIQKLYPSLTTICSRMIEVFMMFSVGSHDNSLQTTETVNKENNINIIRGSRLISTRDLMKWCSRAVEGFDVSSPESALKVLQDAFDIFTCSVASPEHRIELAKKVGTCLGVVETKSEFYCKHYKPNVSLSVNALEVGRAKVLRKEKTLENIDFDNRQVVFSFTRQSACLLERIACCVTSHEPVLLVGETGTGKTSSVQYLARQTGHKLVVINMNQQSDSADLLGGYKPVDLKYVIRPIRMEFERLFRKFYNVEKNSKFLSHIDTCFETENWTALVSLMKQSHKAAVTRLSKEKAQEKLSKWLAFGHKLTRLEQQVKAASKLTFAFIEGSLVKAMQEGHWVLLDEINLASAEILECLAGLLEDRDETIDLLEKGDKMPIKRHPDFTLYACMNPATDVGKKDLPVGLRNRFTEFFIDELTERNDLMLLIGDYLYHMNLGGAILEAIYSFYASIRKEAKLSLVDGAGNAPHYSLRTLCRALTAAAKAKCGTVSRSLYEAFCLSFLTQLDSASHPKVEAMIAKAVIGKKNIKSILNHLIPEPQVSGQNFLLFEGHWIPQGKLEITIPEGYILTPTVRKNLRDIARIISLGRLPVLLQGDTSVGKTSLITYIAKASGNYCMRINNHEHTDLQEYIGSYATDANGKLVFKEGVLVEAMRKGYWIILDELNLAPSDVLEALNRVLDDNRELFIPETQQVVKADPNFMLFATQNPPGLYGGRKMLSRAFRNRFVELHFDEIPRKELETILHQRCHVPLTYSKKMIAVMAELQIRRRGSAAVQGKDGFITLRDLFRWGQRYKQTSKEMLTDEKFFDWDQYIADEGYLILAGKVRQSGEREIIEQVIENHIKRKVNPHNLFSLHQSTSPVTKPILEMLLNNQLEEFSHVVWTYNMRRLAILIAKAFNFDEPVLLVGETGCGKTTICQVLAALRSLELLSVNCHMHTESSDFLGGLRPVRQYKNDGRLFEWVDGPLIKAMESGNMFLADEISLADDSVLERLNSLLEPERQLVLAERGMEENSDVVVITAVKNFHFIGTMNPGGDFGKKELSPALRNRFTEIWCDSATSREDLLKVLEKSVSKGLALGNQEDGSSGIGNSILDFTDWLRNSEVTNKFPFSIRDLLSWVHFINISVGKGLLDTPEAYVHGACMTFLDCFGTALTGHIDAETLYILRRNAINFLLKQISTIGNEYTESLKVMLCEKQAKFTAECDGIKFGIKPFYIEVGDKRDISEEEQKFTFTAPTTGSNTLRLLRGLQLNKAILLEGNPGVGKTSLVTALAKCSGHKVVRINLSDQTDITDLFGTDLPTEDGSFTFKEGALLNALQQGDWILLDELNLAPQPVLEGLNACLDHRSEVFIPELGKTFKVKKQTRIFACQNPLKQGGARRGLPVSFLNRFTQVYIDTLTKEDLIHIVEAQYPTLPKDVLHKMVTFNCKVSHEITEIQSWAHRGSPWEMNLRDIQRWCEALIKDQKDGRNICPGQFVDILYTNRMRTVEDKEKMIQEYEKIFCPSYPRSNTTPQFNIVEKEIIIGDVVIERNEEKCFKNRRALETNLLLLRNQLPVLKALAQNVKMNWLSILVGASSTGKSSVIQVLADITSNDLQVIPVTSAMDVSDLLGGFEQVDYNRNLENLYDQIETLTIKTVRNIWLKEESKQWRRNKLLSQLFQYKNLQYEPTNYDSKKELEHFTEKIKFLLKHCQDLIEKNVAYEGTWSKLKTILNNLKDLQTKVNKAGSLNAGGRFEWVDSLLVKTMTEGSWLVLDNVNLTSAAVLDRLNGLLELNGVLSIPERGEFSDIKPHPNFRVFFTMDPKYGEISRAMRNRGVEIFLLRSEDWNVKLSDTISYMDLVALLSSCGLPTEYHQVSIECHELMSAFIQGFERPTISNLLQAAYLAWQQILRGISYEKSLLNSFSDVYIKPRCGADFASEVKTSLAEMKNSMLRTLEQRLKEEKFQIASDSNTDHTLTVRGLCSSSFYEISKQIAYPLLKESFENPSCLLFNFFTSYQRCPKENLLTLHNIVQENLNSITFEILKSPDEDTRDSTLVALSGELNRKAFDCLQTHSNIPQPYKRFYLEYYKLDSKSINETNALTLLLYYELAKLFTYDKPVIGLCALDYSKAVSSGTLADEFDEYPILKHCALYLQIIDKYVDNILKSSMNYIDDKNACLILQVFNWRSRFLKTCFENVYFKDQNSRTNFRVEEVVPLLYIHSKWLEKYLIGELLKLSPDSIMQSSFLREVSIIAQENDHENLKIVKVAKKMRKFYGQPKLYVNEKEYNLCAEKSNVYEKLTFDMNQSIESQTKKLIGDIYETSPTSFSLDVPDEETMSSLQTRLAAEEITDEPDIKLLPIKSYILQKILNILQNDLSKIMNLLVESENKQIDLDVEKEELVSVIENIVNVGKTCAGVCPALVHVIDVIKKIIRGDMEYLNKRISSLPSEFWNEFYKALVISPAWHPLPFITYKRELQSDDVIVEAPSQTKRMTSNLPLMPYYVQKLTVSKEGSRHLLAYETVSLEDRSKYSLQMSSILQILWQNIAMLDTACVLKLKSDAMFEISKYEKLLQCIKVIDTEKLPERPITNPDVATAFKYYVKHDYSMVHMITDANHAYKWLLHLTKDTETHKLKIKVLTAELSLQTSLLFVKLISEMSPVDEVEKYRLKAEYINQDIEMFDTLLSSYYLHGLVSGTISSDRKLETSKSLSLEDHKENKESLKKVHPYCAILMEMKEKTAEKIYKYASGNTFRPGQPTYSSFVKDCRHFTKSVLAPKTIEVIYTNLINTCNTLEEKFRNNDHDQNTVNAARNVLKETLSWLYSVNAFYKKIGTGYSVAFPDLAKPLQRSLSQTIYSVTALSDLIKEFVAKLEHSPEINRIATDLLIYPYEIPDSGSKLGFLHRFVTSNVMQLITKNVVSGNSDLYSAELVGLDVLKMNLLEVKMYCTALERIDDISMNAVHFTLNSIVKVWEKQQRDIEKKKQDDEALYVTKSKCEDEDDDATAHEEIQQMFPSHINNDFSEFKVQPLEQRPVKNTQNTNKDIIQLVITPEDVTRVYKWHSNFVKNLTAAEWLTSPKKLVGNDVVSPFLERYPIFSRIMNNAWEALDIEFEGMISPSLMVLISQIKATVDGTENSSSKPDFYRSAWVSETKQCVPLLHRVKESTNYLLDQWPDFPTLKDIMVIVNRILGFSVTSPVSRFLTGLELLRDKIEEWNNNAHKGNNLIDISLAVGQQIINWRKLEMTHWKECLNNLYQRKQSEAHKYWFYLYSVITSYLNEDTGDPVSADRVVSVLKEFMETSNLAEYEVRLDIVYVYHCHLVHMEQSFRRDELLSILWNTYNYYSQFNWQVSNYIKEKRAPIEKKLRDFVKICTWDRDLSYWNVKDTVEKAHKALHKHTKDFEKVLKESVTQCLVDNSSEVGTDHVGIWDRPKRATNANAAAGGAYLIDAQNHIVLARNIKKYLDQSERPCPLINDGSLLSKVPNLLNKAKTLCKDTMANTAYPALVQALDDFVTLVIETSTHLGSLEVDSTETKEKQTSQAKNIVQQKRKALADLFKYLAKMGLNYRTGLVILSANDNLYDFTIPPVDLDAAMSYLKSRRCDASLSLLWSGCEKYFQKNIARHRLLSNALQSPHKDLGMQNIERCKGFSAQLLKITNIQKKTISKYSRRLCDLRTLASHLTNAIDVDTETNVATLKDRIDILTDCYANMSIVLDQFRVLLNSCPEQPLDVTQIPQFDLVLSKSPVVKCFKNNEEWAKLYNKVKSISSIVSKQSTALHKLTNATPLQIGENVKKIKSLLVLSQNHIDVVNDAKNNLEGIARDINAILEEYQIKFSSVIDQEYVPQHPILRSIVDLYSKLTKTIERIEKLEQQVDVEMEDNTKEIIDQAEDLIATMLLIIQSVYKKHLPIDKSTDNMDVLNAIDEIIDENKKEEENKELLEDKHLKELLQEKLSSDNNMLQLDTLINKLSNLLANYTQQITTNDNEEVNNVVTRLVPILEQIVMFVQYFITQNVAVHRVSCKMLSVLLKIFSDLASKGFCKPSDLDIEDGEGEDGPGKLSSGTGLGDGEGQKDVSDRIENQDQLDDARKPGEDKKEEDNRDCKEEEKGVNMTDDFDSHLQDVERKEGDEKDDEDDEEDPDKQMGDIDDAAEKLDQQIWGSEDEDDLDEEQGKKEKEEKGQGESTGEKEMGAKEEEQGTDDGSEGKERKKKKEINEMEEPEVDDDHVDPHHGNHPPMPEPEDFELPEDMNIDGEEKGEEDQEGETETDNPFEIDIMKDIPEEQNEDKDKEENRNGLDVSSDEDDDNGDGNDGDKREENGDGDEGDEGEEEERKDGQDDKDENKSPEDDSNVEDPEQNPSENPEEPEQPDNNEEKQDEELPKNPEQLNENDEIEQKNHEANPQANPSTDDPSAGDKAENAEIDKGTDDNVETNAEQKKDEQAAPYEQSQEQVGEDKQSTGRSELDKSDRGHRGEKQAASRAERSKENKRFENKPGQTDQERTLGDVNEKKNKQSHTLNVENEDQEDGGDGDDEPEKDADAYQHVKQAKKDDLQVVDAATKEQADQQPTLQKEDEEQGEELKPDEEVPMDVDEDELQVDKSDELKPEKMKESSNKEQDKTGSKKEKGDEATGEAGVEVEGDAVRTAHVPRGSETSYYTRFDETLTQTQAEEITMEEYMSIREWLNKGPSTNMGPIAVWRSLWRESGAAARALCERLRLVLEPTGRSRMTGDYRTGRRLNMRRVIPYIASHFRKDRIWLRRSKPAKREYKIAIAVDDSSSMSDNRSKELAFESLALVSQALNLLESGDLAVLSFGEKPNLLHPFTEQFSEHSGSKILEQLRFDQTKTKIAQLLDFCTVMFEEQLVRSEALNAKLLVIVSDGRGIFSEGETRVIQSVRRARQQGIFLVYVIIDNPDNKDSIMDIRKPIVDATTNSVSFVQYLDAFPFPFYLILRDMSALPNVLGDALRQWFELAANTS